MPLLSDYFSPLAGNLSEKYTSIDTFIPAKASS